MYCKHYKTHERDYKICITKLCITKKEMTWIICLEIFCDCRLLFN